MCEVAVDSGATPTWGWCNMIAFGGKLWLDYGKHQYEASTRGCVGATGHPVQASDGMSEAVQHMQSHWW
jgi:hypothetical protein